MNISKLNDVFLVNGWYLTRKRYYYHYHYDEGFPPIARYNPYKGYAVSFCSKCDDKLTKEVKDILIFLNYED